MAGIYFSVIVQDGSLQPLCEAGVFSLYMNVLKFMYIKFLV